MKTAALKQVQYDPSIFLNVESVEDAVPVILTPEDGLTSQQRWKNETPYLMALLERHCPAVLHGSYVVDYGCGIGRLAKPLIEKHDCTVVGVDISPNMRALAASCVHSDKFFAIAPDRLQLINVNDSLGFDGALAIWTLQHVLDLPIAIEQIRNSLANGGWLFVVNNKQRVLPSHDGRWIDDQKDLRQALADGGFVEITCGALAGADIAPGYLAANTFWAVYRKD